jgi:hypothetical protein
MVIMPSKKRDLAIATLKLSSSFQIYFRIECAGTIMVRIAVMLTLNLCGW